MKTNTRSADAAFQMQLLHARNRRGGYQSFGFKSSEDMDQAIAFMGNGMGRESIESHFKLGARKAAK